MREIANELWMPADTGDNIQSGVVYAANEARFTSVNYSEPLTNYLVGWREPEDLEGLLELVAPMVSVGRRFEFKKAENAEAFLSETDDIRAIGSSFKRVEYKGTSVNEKTHNKGLTIRIDHDDQLGDDWREVAVARLWQRLLRNEIRRALTLIDAAATNAAKVWNSTKNPDGDVREGLKLSADASGIRGNTVLFAEDAWDLRLDSYEPQNTPYAGRAATLTKEQLATKYMVDKVEVIKARFQNTASAKALVQTALTVLMYFSQSGVSKDEPSNVKRFVSNTDSGRNRVYVTEHEKYTDISVEHYSNSVITSTLGIRKLTVASA